MKRLFKKAFTLIELIIVIVIMGIAAKFGMELFIKSYENYIYTVSNNRLMGASEVTVAQIANRLQYRIKESFIFREGDDSNGTFINTFSSLGTAVDSNRSTRVYEWVGYDIDGWRGDGTSTTPTWSGIIDLDNGSASQLNSPNSNGVRITNTIYSLSGGDFDGNGSALFFIGDESINVNDGFAWNGTALSNQSANLHPAIINGSEFFPYVGTGTYAGIDIYEYYRLSWTAYALEFQRWTDPSGIVRGTLWLYYDYRPWLGENYAQNGKKVILMENVQTLRFSSIGDILKVQVCIGDDLFKQGVNSICKEKTIL